MNRLVIQANRGPAPAARNGRAPAFLRWPHAVLAGCAALAAMLPVFASAAAVTPEARVAVERLARFAAGATNGAVHQLEFVYFSPADRDPPPGYRERLARVMGDIREFYAKEMERHGLGRRTIRFECDAQGALVVHDVKGCRPTKEYLGRDPAWGAEIRRDSAPVLAAAGIDPARAVVIYFCNLRTEQDGRTTGIGPYYGSGSSVGPFCWGYCMFTDAAILDPARLGDKTTMLDDEEYQRISVGRYNSIFIGGAAHELGHGLGLPHDAEQADERARGTSLMGSGNRTYGEERRGEGRGSFLTLADALRLASHPMFSGIDRELQVRPECRLEEVDAKLRDGRMEVTGRAAGSPEPYALIAYSVPYAGDDFDGRHWRDYHNTAWTAPLDATNRFAVRVGGFKPGARRVELVVCHVNGSTSAFRYVFRVGPDGVPDLTPFVVPSALHAALGAWAQGRTGEVRRLSAELTEAKATDAIVRPWAAALEALAAPEPPWPALAQLPADTKEVSLSRVLWSDAKVGWDEPARNQFPRGVDPLNPFLNVAGRYFLDGLYAHAPASHVFDLGGQWKEFSAEAGLQIGGGGTVMFVVRADGAEVYRSTLMRAGDSADVRADVRGVKRLELNVEDGGDGNRSDWSVWGAPKLKR